MTSSNGAFSALLTLCTKNSPVTGEFPSQRPVARSVDVFSDQRLNKRSSKQSRGWWFETPLRSLWRHCNYEDERRNGVLCQFKRLIQILPQWIIILKATSAPLQFVHTNLLPIDTTICVVSKCCNFLNFLQVQYPDNTTCLVNLMSYDDVCIAGE